jgi:hypothetical protein
VNGGKAEIETNSYLFLIAKSRDGLGGKSLKLLLVLIPILSP